MRVLTTAIVGLLSFHSATGTDSSFPSDWAIVKKGAFVIPSEGLNWTDPEGRATGKRIGYLRTGIVVKVGRCRHVNGAGSTSGTYCDVQSQNGIAGKTHESLLFPMQRGKTYAVARDGRQTVVLFDRNTPDRPRDSFSHNSGVIIEVVGDYAATEPNGSVDVIALYNLNRDGGLTALSIKKEDLVTKTHVIEYPTDPDSRPIKLSEQIDEGKSVLGGGPVHLWAYRPVLPRTKDSLVDKVSSTFGWSNLKQAEAHDLIAKAFDLVSGTLDKVSCVASVDTAVSTGFSFLGNGLELKASIPLYQTGKLFDMDADVLERDAQPRFWTVTAKTVDCEMGATVADTRPQAIEAVSIAVIKRKPMPPPSPLLTKDMSVRRGLTVPLAVDVTNAVKLFEIEGSQDYSQALKFVRYRIAQTPLLDELNRDERDALAHAIISKLASFVRPSPDF